MEFVGWCHCKCKDGEQLQAKIGEKKDHKDGSVLGLVFTGPAGRHRDPERPACKYLVNKKLCTIMYPEVLFWGAAGRKGLWCGVQLGIIHWTMVFVYAVASTFVWLARAAVDQQSLHAEVDVVRPPQVAHRRQEMPQGVRHREPSHVVHTVQVEESMQSFPGTSAWRHQLTPAYHVSRFICAIPRKTCTWYRHSV